ncbi:hypothetical protein BDW72DRAFT_173807 [Aspergillus terricola var. indicus]
MACSSAKRQREQEELPVHNNDSARDNKKHRPLPVRSPRKLGRDWQIGDKDPHTALKGYVSPSLEPVGLGGEPDDIELFDNPTTANQRVLHCPRVYDPDALMDVDVPDSLTPEEPNIETQFTTDPSTPTLKGPNSESRPQINDTIQCLTSKGPNHGTSVSTEMSSSVRPIKPTRKLVFSMGYRADCDRCRNRVPGHYSHILQDIMKS